MNNDSDVTRTDSKPFGPDVIERVGLAEAAARILMSTRRAAPFGGQAPIRSEEVILLAEYLRRGPFKVMAPEPETIDTSTNGGDWVQIPASDLRKGDETKIWRVLADPVIAEGWANLRLRRLSGEGPDVSERVMGVNYEVAVRLPRPPLHTGEFGNVEVGDLVVNDAIIDWGDGPVEEERVAKAERVKGGNLVEVTTIAGGTRPLPAFKTVTVRYPRPA